MTKKRINEIYRFLAVASMKRLNDEEKIALIRLLRQMKPVSKEIGDAIQDAAQKAMADGVEDLNGFVMKAVSDIAGEECDINMQKQYLQKILSTKSCEKSAEFEQAAEMLQEILEKEDKKSAGESVERCVPVVREPVKPTSRVKPAEETTPEPTASATAESTEAAL